MVKDAEQKANGPGIDPVGDQVEPGIVPRVPWDLLGGPPRATEPLLETPFCGYRQIPIVLRVGFEKQLHDP
jgi:hypothetical protein